MTGVHRAPVLAALLLAAGCLRAPVDASAPATPEPGTSWGAALPSATVATIDPARAAHSPSLAYDAEGTLYVTAPFHHWPRVRAPSPGEPALQSGLWRSHDQGATWHFVDVLGIGHRDLSVGGSASDVAVGPDGRVFVADWWTGSASVSSSGDGGRTWTVAHPVSTLPVVDRPWIVAGRGRVAVASEQLPTGLWVHTSHDGGLTWSGSLVYSLEERNGCTCQPGTLVEGPGGVLYLPDAVTGRLVVARSQDGTRWEKSVSSLQAPFDLETHLFQRAAVDGEGRLYVAWATEEEVVYAASSDGGRTWMPVQRISNDTATRGPLAMSAAGNGTLGVAWFESTDSGWRVVARVVVGAATQAPRIHTAELEGPLEAQPFVRGRAVFDLALGADALYAVYGVGQGEGSRLHLARLPLDPAWVTAGPKPS